MSTVNLPDASKLDSDADTIKDSRPELKKMADAINTIGGQWNTNGGNFGGQQLEVVAGTGISVTSPDSAGSVTITNTSTGVTNYHELTFTTESFNVTAGNPGGSPSIPDVTLTGNKIIHTINYGTHPASSVTRYVNVLLDNLENGETHTIYCTGTLTYSSSRTGLNFEYGGSTLTLSDSSTQSIFDDAGLEDWGCTVTRVATGKFLIVGPNVIKVFE